MFKMNITDNPNCEYCGNTPETIEHILTSCFRYYGARCRLKGALITLGIRDMDIHILLGGGDEDNMIKNKMAILLMKFLTETKMIDKL